MKAWALLLALVLLPWRGFDSEAPAPVHARLQTEGASGGQVLGTQDRAQLLERWNRLSPEEQARFRQRFEQLRTLSPEERESVERRTRRIQARATNYYELFTSEERARLDRLSPEKRREILLALATEEEEEQALRLRAALPADLAQSMDDRRPENRRELRQKLRERQEEKLGPALEHFGAELGLDPKIIERLKLLPFEQRKRKFLELAKELSTEQLAGRELPPGLTPYRWERMKTLEPEEFFAAMMRLRASQPDLAILSRREGHRHHAREEHHEPYEMMMRLRAVGRMSEQDMLELAPLPNAERRSEETRRRRGRMLVFLREQELLSPERLDALESASDEEFRATIFEVTRPPRVPGELPKPLDEMCERWRRRREGRPPGEGAHPPQQDG